VCVEAGKDFPKNYPVYFLIGESAIMRPHHDAVKKSVAAKGTERNHSVLNPIDGVVLTYIRM
jgi:hypothetical protein